MKTIAEMKAGTEKSMKLEWLQKAGSQYQLN